MDIYLFLLLFSLLHHFLNFQFRHGILAHFHFFLKDIQKREVQYHLSLNLILVYEENYQLNIKLNDLDHFILLL